MSYQYIESTGVIVPDTADTLAEVEQEWRDALGRQDLVTTPDTPQGVLITAETVARQGVARNNAELANQINPNLATGLFLDALCALTGLERRPASQTLVRDARLSGIANTNIPAGVRARTTAGDLFALLRPVVIGIDGAASGDFVALEYGPIACPAGELNTIVDAVLGWETLTNPVSGNPGDNQESDEELAIRRRLTLARQGISTVEAQISGLYDLPGVRSLAYRENVSNQTAVIDGITLLPHSVWACVDGGTDEAIALSLLTNKTDGAGWNGAIYVTVIEPYSGQTYQVQFDRPQEIPIMAQITLRAGSTSGIDVQTVVRQAIIDYANGQQAGERGLVVGEPVSPFEFAGAINRVAPALHVSSVQIAKVGGSFSANEIAILLNQKATITESSISITQI